MTNDIETENSLHVVFNRTNEAIHKLRALRNTASMENDKELQGFLDNAIERAELRQINLFSGTSTPSPRVIYDREVIDALPTGTVGYFDDTKGRCSVKFNEGWTDGNTGPLTLWSLGEVE